MVDARLADGSRVNAIIPPLALDGPDALHPPVRRRSVPHGGSIGIGTLTPALAEILSAAVRARLNILISGGTGGGKTTLLNVLSNAIPNSERIVTIEDSAELQLQQRHVVRLETRRPNIEGKGTLPSGIWSLTPSGCGRTASSWARCGVPRSWTCSRR